MKRHGGSRGRFRSVHALAAFLAVALMLAFGPTATGAQVDDSREPPLLEDSPEEVLGAESAPGAVADPADPDAEFTNPDGVAPHVPMEFSMPDIDAPALPLSEVIPMLDEQGLVAIADQLNTVPAGLQAKLEPGLLIDQDGMLIYEDPAPAPEAAQAAAADPQPGPFPNSQTFQLNSRPGSSKVIYLDFTGITVTGTAWNDFAGITTITSPSYYGASVSQAEHDLIQDVWARVAEDYAPFDVNVTTEDPGAAAITRSSSTDNNYGTRVIITPGPASDYGICSGCGGIAYVGTYDYYFSPGHAYYQPAWVFAGSLSNNAKNIAEATTHEAGHNLGLSHDGTATAAYYTGHNLWAPNMGVAYYRPVSQWSKGEYAGANESEDDFALMQANGLSFRTDDHTDSFSTAAVNLSVSTTTSAAAGSVAGVVSEENDQDVFEYVGDCAGGSTVTFRANNNAVSPNLDIWLGIYNNAGTQLTVNNPTAAYVSTDVASGLDAVASHFVANGQRVYASVDGVGVGTASTGYTDWASLGQYTIYADEANPGNDNFPGTALSGPAAPHTAAVSVTGTNCGATKTTTEPPAVGGTVWYNWTAPTTGKVFVSTCDDATNFDTFVQVYTGGSQAALTLQAQNQDSLASWCDDTTHSRIVTMNVTAGTNYKIRVRGWDGEKGDFKLTIKYHWCVVGSVKWAPTIIGTPNAETINGTNNADTILAYGGNDVVNGLGGNDRICGGHGDDTLNGGGGLDFISGDLGNDTITGGDGNDRIRGGAGNDDIIGGLANDLIWGDNGNDDINGLSGADQIWGGNGVDIIEGGGDNDRIYGGASGDTLNGGDGADRLAGGDGNDVLNGDGGDDLLYGQNGGDTLNGGTDDDKLWGNLGNDIMNGNNGDDIMRGASGVDTMVGGEGNDLLAGGANGDTMYGSDGNDQLYGNSGDDDMYGGNGNDTLGGQDGADNMGGGAGFDNCYGGNGAPDVAINCENTNGLPGPLPSWAAEDPSGAR